ncbi:MAG: 5-methylcytosine-specific restriction endonuclease system specificity protein McrC, partial [Lentisphaeria bacterium]|nr:5-methylcytosine-specific restriction endonuclease system specificity protein McrC [Lentisphaeria bacterium]
MSKMAGNTILIKNIYYMLSYAFRCLRQKTYERVAAEEFRDAKDLFAAILAKGVAQLLKQGLCRDYVLKNESLPVIRGKLDMPGTVRNLMRHRLEAVCEFDEFSEDNLFNRILKTTMKILVRDRNVDPKRKKELKRLLIHFSEIDEIGNPRQIQWVAIHFQRNNQNYEMLLNICRFVLENWIQTMERGEYRVASFTDDQMARVYELFLYEYYRQDYAPMHNGLKVIHGSYINWNLLPLPGAAVASVDRPFLPVMKTDIILQAGNRILIVDAKYYGRILQQSPRNDAVSQGKLRSQHLYQIFSYVKNCDREGTGNVSGLLLYAKTNENLFPDGWFN